MSFQIIAFIESPSLRNTLLKYDDAQEGLLLAQNQCCFLEQTITFELKPSWADIHHMPINLDGGALFSDDVESAPLPSHASPDNNP